MTVCDVREIQTPGSNDRIRTLLIVQPEVLPPAGSPWCYTKPPYVLLLFVRRCCPLLGLPGVTLNLPMCSCCFVRRCSPPAGSPWCYTKPPYVLLLLCEEVLPPAGSPWCYTKPPYVLLLLCEEVLPPAGSPWCYTKPPYVLLLLCEEVQPPCWVSLVLH
ncbi:hypothetical protein NQZ68_011201 [Dissostichus eleginoides]|nr:hypothetical protein NQZ68_011201 [Dissostichus eleginoides]